jgi:hypothetical protein
LIQNDKKQIDNQQSKKTHKRRPLRDIINFNVYHVKCIPLLPTHSNGEFKTYYDVFHSYEIHYVMIISDEELNRNIKKEGNLQFIFGS